MAFEREYEFNNKYRSLVGSVVLTDTVEEFTYKQEGRKFYRSFKVRCNICGESRILANKEVSALYRCSQLSERPKNFGYKLCNCLPGTHSKDILNRYKKLVGTKIDGTNLTILNVYIKNSKVFAECLCDCGNTTNAWLPAIKCGHTSSCGCKLLGVMEKNSRYSSREFIGKEYSDLKVLDVKQTDTGGILWLCQCKLCNSSSWINPKLVVERNWHIDCGCKIQEASIRNQKYTSEQLIGTDQGGGIITKIIKTDTGTTHWRMICNFCGTEYEAIAANVSIGHTKSCGCIGMSYGEKVVYKVLKDLGITFISHGSPVDLVNENGNRLQFDFVLKLGEKSFGVIEYDGEQHYDVNKHSFSRDHQYNVERFNRLVINDRIKNEYCYSHGIKLLRLKSTEFKGDELKIKQTIINYFNITEDNKHGKV